MSDRAVFGMATSVGVVTVGVHTVAISRYTSRIDPGRMDSDDLTPPSPKPIDEVRALELRHLADDAVLGAVPNGSEPCDNCFFYLNPDAEISYCWHPKLRILVGRSWWCQWWEAQH